MIKQGWPPVIIIQEIFKQALLYKKVSQDEEVQCVKGDQDHGCQKRSTKASCFLSIGKIISRTLSSNKKLQHGLDLFAPSFCKLILKHFTKTFTKGVIGSKINHHIL